MRTLIVGAGALGGLIAARLVAAENGGAENGGAENGGAEGRRVEVALATRDGAAPPRLRVRGVGGDLDVLAPPAATLADYESRGARFDLAVLATKAAEAIELAPRVAALANVVVPIQNGGVAEVLAQRLGTEHVLGAISNLGATMHAPGDYEQKNAGHLLLDGAHPRGPEVAEWLERGVIVRTTPNFRGAVWAKLLLNCSVTSIGAIAGDTMRAYITRPEGRALFDRAYAEALAVARASGVTPERMLVDPVPPAKDSPGGERAYDAWLDTVLAGYGDVKPSMLQDFERGRRTEIDFINGFVAVAGRRLGVATPANDAIAALAHAIERGERAPAAANLGVA